MPDLDSQGLPKDDDRGRVYYSVDLVSKGSWALPDSQHMCGGA
ncbi:hypothetical protein [Mesorhizobium sp. M8A.F.Ca.ET.057.01.1.1]|nr:hypothetical protein [Mesorhizobium sp. M8A.F.Ca.ET.057.01.1.1]